MRSGRGDSVGLRADDAGRWLSQRGYTLQQY